MSSMMSLQDTGQRISTRLCLLPDKNNEVDDYTLYSLGLKDPEEVRTLFKKMMVGESYENKKGYKLYI